eukprot:5093601-Pyramimonas_sp.AAC.2
MPVSRPTNDAKPFLLRGTRSAPSLHNLLPATPVTDDGKLQGWGCGGARRRLWVECRFPRASAPAKKRC